MDELLELGPFPRSELLGGLGGIDCCCPTAGDIDLDDDDPVGEGVGRIPGVPRWGSTPPVSSSTSGALGP